MSATRKMMAQNVPSNRIVTTFPRAYNENTPYQKSNFHPKVKSACTENRTGCVGCTPDLGQACDKGLSSKYCRSSSDSYQRELADLDLHYMPIAGIFVLKICKAVLVGDVAVGKTCFVNRICHDVFDKDYKATIGVDFEVEKYSVLNTPFTLQIWDTAGQERFKSIASSYYRGANVVIVVFDLSDEGSIRSISKWMTDATSSSVDPIKFVVGTKKDMVSPAACKAVEERAVEVAESLGAEYWSVSSKTGENVQTFSFRCVSLTFDAAVLREVESNGAGPQKSIGAIKVERERTDLYETKKKKMKMDCCK